MKNIYFLLILLLIIPLSELVAQSHINQFTIPPDDQIETEIDMGLDPDIAKKSTFNSKAFGDTLFYTDFANGLPTGWSIVNNNRNNFQWKWDTTYQQGTFSTNRTAIKSTTASNGFMSLPSDFYNTPTPPTGRVAMDTYFQSDTISITPKNSVWVSYQQYVRYCCNASNRLVLQVSTDNFTTFTEYDAINGLAVNTGNTNDATGGQTNIINISTAVSGQSDFQIRFLADGNGRYFWMIDDFAVIEGVDNDLELRDPYMEFNETNYTYYPFYGQIPYSVFPPLPLFGRIYNNGSNTATGVHLEADITHTSFPNGGTGTGLVYSSSSPSVTQLSGTARDTADDHLTGLPRFVPTVLGDFQVDFLATSDSIDNNLGNETATLFFSTSDSVYARDDNGFSAGGTGPASYVRSGQAGGTLVGDRFGTMYIIESHMGNGLHLIPTTVTYRVSDDIRNIGVEIVPKIWEYNEDSLFINGGNFSIDRAFGNEVATSFIPYTVTVNDTSSFLTLPFDAGPAVTFGLDSGQYVVGWETTNIAGNTTFEVLNDASSAALQSTVTSFNYHGHSPGWGWVRVNPGIRLNLGNIQIPSNINKQQLTEVEFNISPNPTKGLVNLNINSEQPELYQMEITNITGQLVHIESLTVNGGFNKQLDLSHLEKGIYFISLKNLEETLTKKIILR